MVLPDERRVDFMDAARATMLLLGIPFHSSEIYRVSNGFTIDSPDASYLASGISGLIHLFRMPAFFLLSGYFAALILQRRPTDVWVRDRLWKLGIPLVATSILLGPFENALVLHFASNQSLTFALINSVYLPPREWINHRWFLIILILYCLTSGFIVSVFGRQLDAYGSRAIQSPLWRVGKYPILLLMPFAAILSGKIVGEYLIVSPALKQYANLYVKYAIFFATGFMAYRAFRSIEQVTAFTKRDVFCACLSMSLYLVTYFAFYSSQPFASGDLSATAFQMTRIGIEVIAGFYAAKVFFLIMKSVVKKPNTIVSYFVGGSFCIYLVHEIFLLLSGGVLLQVSLSPIIEIAMITTFTIVCSVGVFEFVKRSAVLMTIFNGGPIKTYKQLN